MFDAPPDFGLRMVAIDQPERHVLVDCHVGIERVILKHHRDVAVLRLQLVHDAVVDRDRARGDFFEARDHPQEGCFPAARRTDEHEEFIVTNLETQRMQDLHRAKRLRHLDERQGSHQLVSRPMSSKPTSFTMRSSTKDISERQGLLLKFAYEIISMDSTPGAKIICKKST